MAAWRDFPLPKRRVALCGVTLGALALGACQVQGSESSGLTAADGAARGGAAGLGGAGGGTDSAGVFGDGGSLGVGTVAGSSGFVSGGGFGPVTPIEVKPVPPPTLTAVPQGYLSAESGLQPPSMLGPAPMPWCQWVLAMASGAAGAAGATGAGNMAGAAGAPAAADTPFCGQELWNYAPAKRVLYSWTTAEQAAELRQDRVLLTRTETPGLGRGYAFTSMDALAAQGTAPENELLNRISNEVFTKARYAWPNAWATRMGWPGEDYGDQLLRIVLKPDAWIVVVRDAVGIAVIDLDNNLVPVADALANIQRIAAVYFYKSDVVSRGSYSSCGGGYREFVLGNEAMIEEWSLGTQEIRDRIASDADAVDRFMLSIRANPPAVDPASFNELAACEWDNPTASGVDEYLRALSIPSEYYTPLPAELVNLSATLRASLFDPDPLIVNPGG